MKPKLKRCIPVLMVMMLIFTNTAFAKGQLMDGNNAPVFHLKDGDGKTHDLSEMENKPMLILYFFDAESKSSQEGLLNLDQLSKEYKEADLLVWAITLSGREKVKELRTRTRLDFPVLLDQSSVSDIYQARMILPKVYVLGPELKVLDIFQGGGKTTEIMLVRVAERKLQQKQTMIAQAISRKVQKKNPGNVKARTVSGYAALTDGNLDKAETIFAGMTGAKGEAGVLGKEGLAAVYARKGETEKAMALAEEVEAESPDRAYVNVIKGDLLYRQGKKSAAEAEYEKAVKKESAEPYLKAVGSNQLGRYYADAGNYKRSRELYDRAIAIDPYFIEATSNKGYTYEKEGKWDKALEAYRQALVLNKNDSFTAVLAEKAEEMIAAANDAGKRERIDKLVKDLAARYREQKKSSPGTEDTWTSRPMVMTFVDFQEKGGLTQRDGFSTVLTTQLGKTLDDSGRVRVVDRVLLERLLEELNLGSSDLADPETALKLGKVLAAKILGTGTLYFLPNGTLINMKLIDTETSAIPKTITRQLAIQASLEKEINALNREIIKAIIQKYPLQGYIVQVEDDQVMINLGSMQGVVMGTKFEVIEEKEPIEYRGKLLRGQPKTVAEIEVTQVEPDLCFARIIKKDIPLKEDQKVREQLDELVARGGKNAGQ